MSPRTSRANNDYFPTSGDQLSPERAAADTYARILSRAGANLRAAVWFSSPDMARLMAQQRSGRQTRPIQPETTAPVGTSELARGVHAPTVKELEEYRIREAVELARDAQEFSSMQARPSEDFTAALAAEGLLAGPEQPSVVAPQTAVAPERPVTTFRAPDAVYQPNGYYPN